MAKHRRADGDPPSIFVNPELVVQQTDEGVVVSKRQGAWFSGVHHEDYIDSSVG
ncbi:hypothetical protein HWC66_gp61 [Gordonia phage Chikenjars]|uniref:Uncharacterized protein n=2 Tax=Kenoshavirus TaxID=2842796 RepID=A0A410TCL4_9CAUD|nr:hypothetical protein HWC06_gp61 [Gordonia phage Duffington]YP_009852163.1 hypothetical protein HWC66_gp61 [Gordonia phage Chikenjars]QXO14086.1 hypothetical protein SEA_ALAINAMARIE_62 [Gordonia phage AlainaMarie]QYC54019.1 hypothetical protein SEA_NITHYA_63 [Gordonia phage Nithya]WNN94384.1 hypothetical protein SEA_ENDAVE_64 [Gordonia phage EndAve]QAU06767.1 hypothetical protein SEA_DUFFINGTON_61 [Gordonia phage Duffington]QEQ94364.1 hypothetical protein SEA_CHIKENJARS_61 [Gordonia phage C